MSTDTALIEKREELKRRLTAGEYKTLVDVLLTWANRIFQKITRRSKPLPIWLITVFLGFIVALIGFAALFVAGKLRPTSNAFERFGLTFESGILLVILIDIFNITSMLLLNGYIGRVFTFWRDDVLEVTESTESLERFEDWLEKACDRRLHLVVTLIGSLFLTFCFVAGSMLRGILFSYVSIFGLIIIDIIVSVSIYLLWVAILLPIKLYQYNLKLFPADPSSSEIVARLSSQLGSLVYIIALTGTIGALLTTLAGELFQVLGVAQALLVWLPLLAIFTLNQSSLSSIIRRVKRKTLKEIQGKVEKLQISKNFGNQETMEAINRLMDYHDRVKATRDSALDFRTYLNFFNSLLLPLLAFVLGNLDLVLKLFGIKP